LLRLGVNGREADLTYDYQDRLVRYVNRKTNTTVSFAYDPFGRRIAKTVTRGNTTLSDTRYRFGDAALWNVIEERDASGNTLATYVHGNFIDEVVSMTRGGTMYYFHGDDLDSALAVTDSLGNVVERYGYSDFGAPIVYDVSGARIASSAIGNPYLFAGREWDPETGLYYVRSRYLDPYLGRFITRDRIGVWGDPGNFGNAYNYAGFDPGSWVDPFGMLPWYDRWLNNAANFSAGFADSLSFGATDWVREQIGVNDVVDHDGGWYKGGEYTQIGVEVAVTGGGAALRHAAAKKGGQLIRREANRQVRKHTRPGYVQHHVNTIKGHPAVKGGRGARQSHYPTGGLPDWFHSGRWNIKYIKKGDPLHDWQIGRASCRERV
jgi:RHS repeat-associated protein